MSVQIKTPNITGATVQEKQTQMNSYLFQLARQLQWAFDTLDTGTQSVSTVVTSTSQGAKEALDTAATFAGIKSLIIKSADIVEAYYEEMNKKFSGVYVAQSTFGTYSEETDQRITENSTAIERNFVNIQQVTTDMESVEKTLVGVNAYINSGLLYYDSTGTPVYGIEVGQRTEVNGAETFNKYARFTANKLSFYDANDNEVAYISDYKLYITNVEVTGSYRIGHLVDTVQSDGSVVTKYVGGDS